ncbi:AAA family ATPase [Halostella sp. PRR32]|uniref:AAA family ATPase n=1 Tax=Halostella sp. PRR32 TaxID=3098147 RepID=UPI002B1E6F4B|nr:AAA family ATPase [Halostella sp. PRR32]
MLRPDLLSHDLIPERDLVVHRSDELNEITQAFDPVLDGRAPMNLFLFGPSGVGKTMTARIAVDELEQEAAVSTSYVNCRSTTSHLSSRSDLTRVTTRRSRTGGSEDCI